mmetsp:Transcript_68515/g.182243  ORF Transcript_68515/g.182243 Transcript_68515/m.182243 type:complete len:257 (+) Transcript_68515:136-906(+)
MAITRSKSVGLLAQSRFSPVQDQCQAQKTTVASCSKARHSAHCQICTERSPHSKLPAAGDTRRQPCHGSPIRPQPDTCRATADAARHVQRHCTPATNDQRCLGSGRGWRRFHPPRHARGDRFRLLPNSAFSLQHQAAGGVEEPLEASSCRRATDQPSTEETHVRQVADHDRHWRRSSLQERHGCLRVILWSQTIAPLTWGLPTSLHQQTGHNLRGLLRAGLAAVHDHRLLGGIPGVRLQVLSDAVGGEGRLRTALV